MPRSSSRRLRGFIHVVVVSRREQCGQPVDALPAGKAPVLLDRVEHGEQRADPVVGLVGPGACASRPASRELFSSRSLQASARNCHTLLYACGVMLLAMGHLGEARPVAIGGGSPTLRLRGV
jgi:hypothetical protein